MIMNVTVTRWRNVTADADSLGVAAYVKRGRNLLAAAALNPSLKPDVMDLAMRVSCTPERVERVPTHLNAESSLEATAQMPPSDLYALADDPQLKDIAPDVASLRTGGHGNDGMTPKLDPAVIRRAFGTPKPTLTHSYRPGLALSANLSRPDGVLQPYSGGKLGIEQPVLRGSGRPGGVPADRLDAYVPEWNRAAIENIFATHLEDWPALIRSLRTTADKRIAARTRSERLQ